MKIIRYAAINAVILLLFCGLVFTAEKSSTTSEPATPQATSPAQPLKNLPSTIKLDPSLMMRKVQVVKHNLPQTFYVAWAHVTSAHNTIAAALPQLENQLTVLDNKINECLAKNYTQQDMTAAGCTSSDTLAWCENKLFMACIGQEEYKSNQMEQAIGNNFQKLLSNAQSALDELNKWAMIMQTPPP